MSTASPTVEDRLTALETAVAALKTENAARDANIAALRDAAVASGHPAAPVAPAA